MASVTSKSFDPSYLVVRKVDPNIQRTEEIRPWIFEILSEVGDTLETTTEQSFDSSLTKIVKKCPPSHHPDQANKLLNELNHALQLNQKDPEEDSETWIFKIVIGAKIFLDSQSVLEVREISVPKEMEELLSTEAETLSCFDYAFCQIKETRALHTEYSNEEVPALLKRWGYTQAKEPREGDLVLYLNQNQPTHLAVFRGKGIVESKWGNETPVAYLHRIEQAPTVYGDQILYFRAPNNH
jgi:hypothetical protein